MKLSDIISPEDIAPDLAAVDKLGVLKELVNLLKQRHPQIDADEVLIVLLEREKLGSTGTGNQVAIPHGKVDSVSELLVCFGKSNEGVDFESIDERPAKLFFLLVAPSNSIGAHLSALARISNLLNDDSALKKLLEARDAGAIFEVIRSFDEDAVSGG